MGTQHLPQISAHVYCGQTAGCISTALGTNVGLSPGDIVLDGNLAPPKRGTAPPIFGGCLTAGWIKMPLGTEVGLSPDDIVLDRGPASPKGHNPQFSAHVYCGQTVAHLSYCWARFLVVKVNCWSYVFNIIKIIWILRNIKKYENCTKKHLKVCSDDLFTFPKW